MKKITLLLFCFPLVVFGQLSEIVKVADAQLNEYLQKIPVGQEEMFGFSNRDEFSQTKIGVPYEVLTLSTDFFSDERIENNKNYLVSTGNWRVPIKVGDEYKALLTVSKDNNVWSVVKIGAKGLASELGEFAQSKPLITSLSILRVFQLKGDFILTYQNTIYPLTSAVRGLNISSKKEYSIYDILTLLKNKKFHYEK